MKDEEIKKIAQAYGESEANCYDYDMYSNPDFRHKLKAKNEANKAKAVLEWLSERFCIVPKSKVQEIDNIICGTFSIGNIAVRQSWEYAKRKLFEEDKK